MAVLFQSLSGSDCVKVHLTTPNWAQPTLGVRFVTFTVLMHPLNSYSSTEASESSSCWCTTTSPLSSSSSISSIGTSTKMVLVWVGHWLAGCSYPWHLQHLQWVDLSWFTSRSPLGGAWLCTRKTCRFDAWGTGGRFARSRKRLAKIWLASSSGLGVISKISLVKIGSSRLI